MTSIINLEKLFLRSNANGEGKGSCLELHVVTSETCAPRTSQSRGSAAPACGWWSVGGPKSISALVDVLDSSFPVGQDENILVQSFPV